jgi:hypothetical protein
MVGRRLRLNAVVVFISFARWAWLRSFMGKLLATPMLLATKVVPNHVPSMASFGKFLADRDEISRSDRRILKYVFRRDVPLSKRPEAHETKDGGEEKANLPAPTLPDAGPGPKANLTA